MTDITTYRHILLLLVLLAFVGGASATDYYVATWGDNSTQGNITHPWQNVSYAATQTSPGDTVHLFDGTWYNEVCTFANSGNATHRITLTAYNGTPTMIGDAGATQMIGIAFDSYMTISYLTMRDYTHTLFANTGANYSLIHDCDLGHTGGTQCGYVIKIAGQNCHYNTIENCSVHDSGWNTIQLYGNREPPDGSGIPSTHITIRNCTIYDSHEHNAIDLFGNLQHVLIEENTFYDNTAGNIYNHHTPDYTENLTIRNNDFDGIGTSVSAINIYDAPAHNVTISNNTCYNFTGEVFTIMNSHYYTIQHNEFYNCSAGPRFYGSASYNILFNRNVINDGGRYRFTYGATGIVGNPFGSMKEVGLGSPSSAVELLYDDGTVFTAIHSWLLSYIPVRYYPEKSNTSGIARTDYGGNIHTVISYNITLRPTNAYLKDVVVNHESDTSDDRTNITVNSSVSTNPTWINATMQHASTNYSIAVDGSIVGYADSDADGIVSYQYSSSWSEHDFEFDWASSGATNNITLQANEYGLLRKDASADQTISTIAGTIANDTCYQWWNATSDEWMAHYTGDTYNAEIILPKNVSYFVLISAETEITCTEADAETVEMPVGWFSTLLRESTTRNLTAISASMGANVTELYAWDNSTYTWNNTDAYDVLPNQGVFANSLQAFEWDGSVP